MGFDKWKSWKWLNMHEAHKHAHMDQPDKIRKAREKNHNSTLYCCLPLLDEMSVMLGFNSDNNVVCENFWFYPWKSFFCSRFHFLSAVISHFVRSKLVWVVVSSQTSFFSVEGGISSHPYLKAKFKFCWAFSCRASETINSRHAIESNVGRLIWPATELSIGACISVKIRINLVYCGVSTFLAVYLSLCNLILPVLVDPLR